MQSFTYDVSDDFAIFEEWYAVTYTILSFLIYSFVFNDRYRMTIVFSRIMCD